VSPRGTLEPDQELRTDPAFRAAQVLLVLYVVLVVVAFDPSSFDTFTLVKSAVGHSVEAVLATVIVWLIIRHGRAALVWSPIHVATGLVLAAFALATPLALDHQIALFGASRRYLGLTDIAGDLVLYAAAVLTTRSPRDLVRLGLAGALAASGVVVYGLLQHAGLDPIRYEQGSTAQQPIATLGNPDIFGGFLSVVTVTSFAVALLVWDRCSWFVRILLIALGAVSGGLLLTSGIRNGVLGIVVGCAAAAIVGWLGVEHRYRVLVAVTTAIVIGIAVVALSPLGSRLTPTALASDGSVQARFEIWQAAAALVAARPLLGLGPDNFAAGYPSVRDERSAKIYGQPEVLQTSTHSWIFYYLTSAGLIGASALGCALVLATVAALRLARRVHPAALVLVPLGAYLGQGLVDVNDIALDWVMWVALGVLAGATGVALPTRSPNRRASRSPSAWRRSWIVGAPVALAVVLAVASGISRVTASRSLLVSAAQIAVGDQKGAIPPALEATRSDARRPEYWASLGTALAGSNTAAAAMAYLTAAQRAPWQPLYWQDLALVYRAAGNPQGAMAAARRAVHVDPANAVARALVATLLLDAGDFIGAARDGENAVRIFPSEQTLEAPTLAYIKLERWSDAIRLARLGLSLSDSAHLHLRLAQALTGANQIAEARSELAIVLAADPKNAEALDLKDFLASK
jgi:O-antigen ligase/Flp pilus assembly protein TadD